LKSGQVLLSSGGGKKNQIIRSLAKRNKKEDKNTRSEFFLNVLLAGHLSISLDNGQLDTHLLYFTIRLL